ncbi:MAG: fumarate hydratase [Rectinema sp.]|nr:fumarate hydratase [Rectinema sp.]
MPHFSLDSWIFQSLVRKLADGFEPMDLLPPSTSGNRLILNAESIRESARRAFSDIAYVMPQDQLDSFAHIASAPNATSTERFVAQTLLDNAQEAQKGTYPICQDTGTAVIYAWKGSRIEIEDDADIERLLAEGAGLAYRKELLRNSQNGPLSMIEERNTGDNLPAGIQIREVPGDCLVLLCAAKGGGSTSRTSLTMESPAILRPERLEQVLRERIRSLGPSGCPPYTISVVLGGATPSQTLYVAELAALGILDDLPPVADGCGTPLRDRQWEASLLRIAEDSGIGAQWGGTHMAAKVRAIRLARHAAALPLAVTVSCAANRHVLVVADRSGWYREPLAARFEASQTLSLIHI